MLYAKWNSIPLHVRAEIATKFGVAKVGPTHVSNNQIVSDGYNFGDVERALNIKAIQEFLGVEHTDLETLIDLLVAKIEGREILPVATEAEVLKTMDVITESLKAEGAPESSLVIKNPDGTVEVYKSKMGPTKEQVDSLGLDVTQKPKRKRVTKKK